MTRQFAFWAVDVYRPTAAAEFRQAALRDYLDTERRAGRWNGDARPPLRRAWWMHQPALSGGVSAGDGSELKI